MSSVDPTARRLPTRLIPFSTSDALLRYRDSSGPPKNPAWCSMSIFASVFNSFCSNCDTKSMSRSISRSGGTDFSHQPLRVHHLHASHALLHFVHDLFPCFRLNDGTPHLRLKQLSRERSESTQHGKVIELTCIRKSSTSSNKAFTRGLMGSSSLSSPWFSCGSSSRIIRIWVAVDYYCG